MFERSGIRIFLRSCKLIFEHCAFLVHLTKISDMKNTFHKVLILIILVISWGCKEKSHDMAHDHDHHHGNSDSVEVSGNQVLYDQVMKIHDEVMPQMEDLHNRKEALKEKLKSATAEQKKSLERQIAKVDSAGEGMMIWMREFNPIPDSVGEEKAREYLESQMEKVKKVKENIQAALQDTEQK
jgi:hypothetical protein